MFGLTFAVFLFGVLADFSEQIWTWARTLETWQLDEFIHAIVAMVIAGFVTSLHRVLVLEARIAELDTKRQQDPQPDTLGNEHDDCVIKCVGCGNYLIHGNRWLNREDFTALTQNQNVLGGACPACQLTSES